MTLSVRGAVATRNDPCPVAVGKSGEFIWIAEVTERSEDAIKVFIYSLDLGV